MIPKRKLSSNKVMDRINLYEIDSEMQLEKNYYAIMDEITIKQRHLLINNAFIIDSELLECLTK
ncbi:hypothetical protein DERF_007019 [Dermatophagoides farinae]|uniref:Uncharacterized protein n=1 Tax=Dermatophagoides farinae TaxID=6954 RepID=A0A922L432_DERFA|nr:hypothetical protein DERF_007019 [Dermatophagoides farinae]